MIQPNTVFVLGAGASIDYMMPKTSDIRHLATTLEMKSEVGTDLVHATRRSREQFLAFQRTMHASPYFSVDAFLEKRPDEPDTQVIGKAMIAAAFMQRQIHPRPRQGDWIRHVILKMLDGAPAWPQFLNNRVTFITFNFDRVVETIFEQTLPDAYPGVKQSDVWAFITPRVLHIHGVLPILPGPNQPGAYSEWLSKAIPSINVIHEAGSEEARTNARRALLQAHVVCFLGFGYHDENLKKIGFEPGAKPAPTADIFCCGFNVSPSDRAEALLRIHTGAVDQGYKPGPVAQHQATQRRTFGDNGHGALEFLQQHHILRSSM
jgi:hypothetical protein